MENYISEQNQIDEGTTSNHDSPIVLFHKHCLDGRAAAWALFQRFGSNADYIAIGHNGDGQKAIEKALEATNEEKDVYIVDYTPSKEAIIQLLEKSKSVTIADHHVAAKEKTSGIASEKLTVFFDPNESGASLTWKTLVENYIEKREDPWFLEEVRKIDLGTANDLHEPQTEHITTILDNIARGDFWKTIENFSHFDEIGKDRAIEENKDLISKEDDKVKGLLKKTNHITTQINDESGNIKIPIINIETEISNISRNLWREMGKDDTKSPVIMAFYVDDKNIAHVSVRHNIYSEESNGIHVDDVARYISKNPNDGGRETAAVMHINPDFLNKLSSNGEDIALPKKDMTAKNSEGAERFINNNTCGIRKGR